MSSEYQWDEVGWGVMEVILGRGESCGRRRICFSLFALLFLNSNTESGITISKIDEFCGSRYSLLKKQIILKTN